MAALMAASSGCGKVAVRVALTAGQMVARLVCASVGRKACMMVEQWGLS